MNFWDKKLAGEKVVTPALLSSQLFGVYTTPVLPVQTVPTQVAYTPPANLRQGSTCPQCNSDRYTPRHTNGAAMSCPDCGYNVNFEHIGRTLSSMSIPVVGAEKSRQVPSAGFNMQGELARLNSQARINAQEAVNN